MTAGRQGQYVPRERKRDRRAILVSVKESEIGLGSFPTDVPLGFEHGEATAAAAQFVGVLNRLCDEIVEAQAALARGNDPAAYEDAIRQTLVLSPARSSDCLRELRQLGAPLRARLSQQAVQQFRFNGFNFMAGHEAEPPLTFYENVTELGKAPILWEMMHEKHTLLGRPDWREFWGFRVPITYWVYENRNEEISLSDGLFLAVDEGLGFAGREVNVLTQRLGLSDARRDLTKVLRERVERESGGRAMDWNAEWLAAYLTYLSENKGMSGHELEDWKKETWVSVFKEPPRNYGLVHFACHCEPSPNSEFLSRLDVRVAGARVSLDVALMSTDMKRSVNSVHDAGPLVFLNACGSGQPNPAHQPPGFPLRWIDSQGAPAVLATLCPVPDYFAYSFAQKFYSILTHSLTHPDSFTARNSYLAQALLLTRRYFMKHYRNPLGLAYILYGIRDVRIEADYNPAGGGL